MDHLDEILIRDQLTKNDCQSPPPPFLSSERGRVRTKLFRRSIQVKANCQVFHLLLFSLFFFFALPLSFFFFFFSIFLFLLLVVVKARPTAAKLVSNSSSFIISKRQLVHLTVLACQIVVRCSLIFCNHVIESSGWLSITQHPRR